MRQRSSKNNDKAKSSRINRRELAKRSTRPFKDTTKKVVKPNTKRTKLAIKPKVLNSNGSSFKHRALVIVSCLTLSATVFVSTTPAQAVGLVDVTKFLEDAERTMSNFFNAGSIMAIGAGLSDSTVMENNSKSAQRLAGAIQSINNVKALKNSMTSIAGNNIPESLKCTALYDNKYSLFQKMLVSEYTYQQMSLVARDYSKTSEQAQKENVQRNMEDYCSVDETKMKFCTFNPDGTDAASQDYSIILDTVRMDPIVATAATDLANNMVLVGQTQFAQSCDSADCNRIRDTERQYTAIASLVHGSVLGQVNASMPLSYQPLRDYVNENLGINTGNGSTSTPPATEGEADANKEAEGGKLTGEQIKDSAKDVAGKGEADAKKDRDAKGDKKPDAGKGDKKPDAGKGDKKPEPNKSNEAPKK